MEVLDVLDERGQLTGQKEDRIVIHEKNLWHIHVGIWLMNPKGELLFQKRSHNKKVNPNKWTRTGGHVDAGETPLIGIQRETQEEVGVKIPIDKIELIDIKKQSREKGKHFVYSYFAFVNYKLEDYTMQMEEVSDLKYMSIEEMEEAYKNNDENYTFVRWADFRECIEYLKNKRKEMINL